jgi:hypothetical protein
MAAFIEGRTLHSLLALPERKAFAPPPSMTCRFARTVPCLIIDEKPVMGLLCPFQWIECSFAWRCGDFFQLRPELGMALLGAVDVSSLLDDYYQGKGAYESIYPYPLLDSNHRDGKERTRARVNSPGPYMNFRYVRSRKIAGSRCNHGQKWLYLLPMLGAIRIFDTNNPMGEHKLQRNHRKSQGLGPVLLPGFRAVFAKTGLRP